MKLTKDITSEYLEEAVVIQCTNVNCRKTHILIGNVKFFARDNEVSKEYFKIDDIRIYPTHFQPVLNLFPISEKVLSEIKNQLLFSFNHLWYDLEACANKIRQALELIVDNLGAIGNNLHQKIEYLRKTSSDSELYDELLALKWIGNEGSHAQLPFSRAKILDMYEVLISALNRLYPDEDVEKRIKHLVENINKNKGIKNI